MTPRRLFTRAGLAAYAASALITLSPKASHAEQFTLFDVTFNFTWEDAINASPSKSHYYVKSDKLNPMRPTNWLAPIDYRTGKVHIYLEVLEKPEGGQKQGWALCYVGGGSYGCPYTKYYTEKGIYESDVDMTSFYNNATIDWTKGITEVDLVYTINDSGSGHVHFFPELKDKTTPTKVRIAMVQVSKGATYDPSKLPGGMGAGGMGAGGGSGMGGSGGAGGMAAGGSGGTSAGAGGTAGGGSAGTDSSTGGVTPTAGAAGTGVVPAGGMASSGTAGAPAAGSGTTNPGSGGSDESAGCGVGPAPIGSGKAWFALCALAGLAGVLRRRQMRG
jgi:MYXO-CTERM domain-containing protein